MNKNTDITPHQCEQKLLFTIAGGDQLALIELFNWYFVPLGKRMFDIIGSLELAEQAVQDAFVMVWQQKESLLNIKKFSGYLFFISQTMAVAAKEERKQQVNGKLKGNSAHPLWETREDIQKVVDRLPYYQREIYLMLGKRRLSSQEIAVRLNITVELVNKKAFEALKTVRMELSKYIPPCVAVVLTSVLVLGD